MVRREGGVGVSGDRFLPLGRLAGDANPIPLQLNVAAHCILC